MRENEMEGGRERGTWLGSKSQLPCVSKVKTQSERAQGGCWLYLVHPSPLGMYVTLQVPICSQLGRSSPGAKSASPTPTTCSSLQDDSWAPFASFLCLSSESQQKEKALMELPPHSRTSAVKNESCGYQHTAITLLEQIY